MSTLLRQALGDQIQLFGRSVDPATLARRMASQARRFLPQPDEPLAFAALTLALIVGAILTFVLPFYFLVSGGRLAEGALRLVPPAARERVREVARRADPALRRYVVGLTVIVAYAACTAWIGLGLVFGLSHALLIAVVVGFLEPMPIVGPAISIALIGLSGVPQANPWLLVGSMGFAVALRVSIDQVVALLVLGRAATRYGALGLLLAVPVATVAKIALATWYGEDPRS